MSHAIPASPNATQAPFKPAHFSDGVRPLAAVTLVWSASLVGSIALKTLSEIGAFIVLGGGIQAISALVLSGVFGTTLNYCLEKWLDDAQFKGHWRTAVITAKYVLPMLLAGAVSFALTFGLPLGVSMGITCLSAAVCGGNILKVRDPNSRDYRNYKLLTP